MPRMINSDIVSVRQTVRGRGSSLRVFVNIKDMLCFSDACLSKYSTVPLDLRQKPWCDHLQEAVGASLHAKEIKVNVQSLVDLNVDEETLKMVRCKCPSGMISVYEVNRSTIALPTFGIGLGFGMTHVKDLECKIRKCRSLRIPHALAKRKERICIHNLLVLLSGKSAADSNDKCVTNKIDHVRTIDILIEKVQQDFPKMDEESLKNFMPSVLNFVDKIRYVPHMKQSTMIRLFFVSLFLVQ